MSGNERKRPNALFVFLIHPFLGFLVSLRSIETRMGAFVFIAFSTLWGYAQSFTYTPADGYRIGAGFCQYPEMRFGRIIEALVNGDTIDIYIYAANYLVHQFSDNVKVYFALLGFVFGLLCWLTLSNLYKEGEWKRNSSWLLFLLFITASFSNLSMPRYWTAAWFAALVFMQVSSGRRYYAVMAVLLPLIHFSYIPVAIALIVISLFNRSLQSYEKILFFTALAFFVISFILPQSIIESLIPDEAFDNSAKLRSKSVYIQENTYQTTYVAVQSSYRIANNFVTKLFQYLMKIGSMVCLFLFHRKRNKIRKNDLIYSTYICVLTISIVLFFMSTIRSTGWRYIWVLWMFLYILLIRTNNILPIINFKRYLSLLVLINVYTISFMFYVAYRTVDPILFFGVSPMVIAHGVGFPPVFYV